jgi:hypothetical protein
MMGLSLLKSLRTLRILRNPLIKLRKSEEGQNVQRISSHERRRQSKVIHKVKSLELLLVRRAEVNWRA